MGDVAGKRRNSKVMSIGVRPVPGGKELIAYSKSARGTRYILGSVVYLTEGLSKDQIASARAQALDRLLYI